MSLKKKHGLAIKVFVIVVALVAVKIILHNYDIQFISPTPVFVGLISGAIFIIGFISIATMTDYKESERIVSEFTASLESLLEEGYSTKKKKPKFDLEKHKQRLLDIVASFKEDLKKIDKKRRTLVSVSRLSESIDEMDEIGVVPNYVVRMKAEQENLFKNVWRSFQIKETTFIPAAYSVVEIVSGFLIVCLMFMNLDPFIESLAILSMLMYLFIYLVFFIKDMDDPFGGEVGYVNIDLFILDELEKKVQKSPDK